MPTTCVLETYNANLHQCTPSHAHKIYIPIPQSTATCYSDPFGMNKWTTVWLRMSSIYVKVCALTLRYYILYRPVHITVQSIHAFPNAEFRSGT